MSDIGLGALQRKTKGNKGPNVPPPMHRARTTPVTFPKSEAQVATPEAAPAEPAPTAAPEPAATPTTTPPSPAPSSAPKTPAKTSRAASTPSEATPDENPLMPATVYLTAENDDFLEDVKRAGRRSQPKIDANRAAVVRLALARLADQMTPEQVAQELAARAGRRPGKIGRTRL
ncbi:hypothetical protein RDE2_52720 (plasmid) [Rhodococcus sp. RDE2]|nr:hypothetical protein RDE2_52720 [Rhodococcus sp. RDE2]